MSGVGIGIGKGPSRKPCSSWPADWNPERNRATPTQHLAHRVARHLQLANDLLDRLPFDNVLAPDPPNRLHNQHPPATHSCSPSGQPVQLIADGVKVGRRSPLYGGESSTPKHSKGQVSRYGCSSAGFFYLIDRCRCLLSEPGKIPGLLQVLSRRGGKGPAVPVPKELVLLSEGELPNWAGEFR